MGIQWGKFIGTIAMQGKLVSTYQLGFEGKQIASDQSTKDGFYLSESNIIPKMPHIFFYYSSFLN